MGNKLGEADTDQEILLRRNRELGILNQISQALNREVDIDRALHSTLAEVAELLRLRTGWIWLLREGTEETYLAASQNLPPGLAQKPERMEGSCYCLDTYRAGDLDGAANVNVVTCSRLSKLVDGTGGLRYHASIPLYALDKKLGVLNVASSDWRELSPEDLQLLYTVGDMLSIAIQRARLFEGSVRLGALEERNRLARDIHDTLAQGLTAISLRLETAEAIIEAGGDAQVAEQAVHQALQLTRENLEDARRSVLDLRAAPLEGQSLADALMELTEEMGRGSTIELEFSSAGGSRPLPVRVESGLFRIAQEALNNVLLHSRASQAFLHLAVAPDSLRMIVRDDGRGFESGDIPDGRFGLQGIQERARILGGSMNLESTVGSGTILEISLPLT